MNALVPMALLRQAAAVPADGDGLPDTGSASGAAVWHDLWHSRHGAIRIEVIDGVCYVNGDRVEPATPPVASGQGAVGLGAPN